MSSNLKVNNILPSTGTTVAVSGIASVTSSVSIASSCTATTFYGSGANLTNLPSQVTINNATANRVLTSDGGTTLNGESNLTFDGHQLSVQSTASTDPLVVNSTQANRKLIITETSDANSNGGLRIRKKHSTLHPANYWYGDIAFQGWDGDEYRRAGLIECVAEGTPANDNMPGQLRFSTNSGTTSQTERFRITASGQLRLMEGNNVKMSVYHDSSGGLNHITSNNGNEIKVSCGNGDSNGIEFWDYTGTNKRCQIDGHGIKFNADTSQDNALNDYETGTWTPNMVGSSGSDTWNYRRSGKYTKIGNKVTASWSLGQYNGNLSGNVYINNLPFTIDFRQYGGDIGLYDVNTPSGTIIGYFIYLEGSTTNAKLYWTRSGQQGVHMSSSDLIGGNRTFYEGNVTYYTNS